AHVFRWADTLAFETDRIPTAFLGSEASFKDDLMFPAVTEVVLVQKSESLPVLGDDLADLGHGRIDAVEVLEAVVEKLRIAVPFAIDLELVEMRVGPAHRRLNVFVELVERA